MISLTDTDICWSCFQPPSYPGDPFGSATFGVDCLRCAVLGMAVAIICILLRACFVTRSQSQRIRFICMMLLVFLVSTIEFFKMGTIANWRLFAISGTFVWMLYSSAAFLSEERQKQSSEREQQSEENEPEEEEEPFMTSWYPGDLT